MNVAIRADASPEIGTGHLMRCLTLADALAREEAKATFLCAPAAEPWRAMIESHGHHFMTLPLHAIDQTAEAAPPHACWAPWGQAADAAVTLDALDAMVDWLIVDHYALDSRWERAVRPRARRILAIDDLADRDHDCDVLLDHNPQDETGARYDKRLVESTRRLIGPRYALLRPEFALARARLAPRDGCVRRIAIFMGGTDPDGATLTALEALSLPRLAEIPVDVAIGAASPHLAAIRRAAVSRGNTAVHVNLPSLTDLFSQADLAIGAGGVAALERCCVGLPSITVAIASNQEPSLEQLARSDTIHHLGRLNTVTAAELAAAILHLVEQPEVVASMAVAAAKVADGQGLRRVMSVFATSPHGREEYRAK